MNSYAFTDHLHSQVRSGTGALSAATKVLVLCASLLIYALLSQDLITNSQALVANTILLLGYLSIEAKTLWASEPALFWINPVVLASIFTFVMAFGVTNVLYFMPEEIVGLVGIAPVVTNWMNQLMLLVLIGAISMWSGYNSGIGHSMGRMLQRSYALHKWISPSVRVNRLALFAFLGISLFARLLSIELGLYGYSSSYDQLIEAASYKQYLSMLDALGTLALVGVAQQCFAAPRYVLFDQQLL